MGMGDNSSGQLGDGTNTTTNSPKLIVAGPPGFNQFFSQSKTGSDLQLGFAGYVGAKYALDRTFSLAPPLDAAGHQHNGCRWRGGVHQHTNPATNNFLAGAADAIKQKPFHSGLLRLLRRKTVNPF